MSEQPKYESKPLSEDHALRINNISLQMDLAASRMESLKKDYDTGNSILQGFVNSIKGQYFPDTDAVIVRPSDGLILREVKEEKKAEEKAPEKTAEKEVEAPKSE